MVKLHLPRITSAVLAIAPVFLVNHATIDRAPPPANHVGLEVFAARDTARGDSGIAGQFEIRPIRPHATIGAPDTEPYQGKVEVVDAKGHAITTVESDADGSFRIALPPGKYTLKPQSPGLYPRATEQTVVVAPQRFTQVHIVYDSGIR